MFLVSIKFKAAFGQETKIVEISSPSGGGGDNFHLYVDDYYWGRIGKMLGGWRVMFQLPNDEFSGGDLQVLIDMVAGENQNEE